MLLVVWVNPHVVRLAMLKLTPHYADTTVIITDNLVDYVHNYAIPQTDVDYVVEVEKHWVIQKVSLLVRWVH